MKKMLLVSMFQSVANLLPTVVPNLKNKTVTYIPTASKVEKLGFFVNIGKLSLRKLGIVVDELDVSTSSPETISNTLQKNDMIYVSGGNTFYLLQELKRSGADQVLIDEVNNGKLYIGESAGAIVVAPDITYSAIMDHKEKAPELRDYSGLHLVDFYVVPHCGNWEMGKAAENIAAAYADSLELMCINDRQAIFVEGENARILNR